MTDTEPDDEPTPDEAPAPEPEPEATPDEGEARTDLYPDDATDYAQP